jgi:hypothetical protein
MNDNKTRHDIPNRPPTVGDKRAGGQFQVTLELNGARRTTNLPLTNSDIAQLALAAAARDISMGQLLTDIMSKAIRKNMIEEILREPSQEPATKPEDA